jgi:hypothetical protein
MGMTGTYGFANNVTIPAAPGTVYFYSDVQESTPTVPGMVSPFRRAGLRIKVAFDPAYGDGAAGMEVSLEASLDGTDWFTTTIHDRLATVPVPLTDPPDAASALQDLQADGIGIDGDLDAEVADTQNHWPYFRLCIVNATIPCTLSAWLHASG